jgi:hypothetical protein
MSTIAGYRAHQRMTDARGFVRIERWKIYIKAGSCAHCAGQERLMLAAFNMAV